MGLPSLGAAAAAAATAGRPLDLPGGSLRPLPGRAAAGGAALGSADLCAERHDGRAAAQPGPRAEREAERGASERRCQRPVDQGRVGW